MTNYCTSTHGQDTILVRGSILLHQLHNEQLLTYKLKLLHFAEHEFDEFASVLAGKEQDCVMRLQQRALLLQSQQNIHNTRIAGRLEALNQTWDQLQLSSKSRRQVSLYYTCLLFTLLMYCVLMLYS